jgi:hypothetical protein
MVCVCCCVCGVWCDVVSTQAPALSAGLTRSDNNEQGCHTGTSTAGEQLGWLCSLQGGAALAAVSSWFECFVPGS